MKREDGRGPAELRPTKITRHYLKYPAGSVLIEMGNTKVICTATIQEKVPDHKRNSGSGWVTAEYAMIPGATSQRSQREQGAGKPRGRTQEIQRLIGRSLRAVVDDRKLGERTIMIDADVIQADGGTRTAAITGSFVALHDAVSYLLKERKIEANPIREFLAAVSVGVVEGSPVIDLPYQEDSSAEVDMNLVVTESGQIVEIQGTAESKPFSRKTLDAMIELGEKGIKRLIALQRKTLGKDK
ncbi:ribonuclease PH [candidate division WOR-1 bacterium RIFCSPHIGHO2_01_FULL_53_15]|uniref:Ribonuclease PH n=1 Tax=candidate division WOR-1 bacterium RIFCSPHIGHO2_01_FULL_53_15 TaxID=1802564 RepID=A0A1F4Q326_UNCSA|nr:MAG: ribonuclease PH [candidate division WOR-1 bacterium RIFCSPHIGHO2_01_FULL_53_15]OGC10358.1 MAG: ribonuclease PH [candidate division WOR-1 bacterium RIFCSPHIGHO2_02_FULL_53_26]